MFGVILDYVPASKKSKALQDPFGDTCGHYSQTVKTSRELAHAKIAKYKDTASLIIGDRVLEWWKSHQTEFPLLANLTKTYLCISGTSVPSVFSTAGDIVRSEPVFCLPKMLISCFLLFCYFFKKNLLKKKTGGHT